jgi:hypothetical protein
VQTGRDAEGAAALERARAMRWSGSVGEQHPWLDPQALLLLAGAKERLGDRQAALDAVDALLRNWDRADPDLPGLADARAMRKRLAPKTAQATQR